MASLGAHVPPRAMGARANTCGGAPKTPIRFRLPSAKKPIDRLSGDQNGSVAFSVPAKARGEMESSERSHNIDRLFSMPEKTTFCPSGDIANDVGLEVGGALMST